MPEGSYYFQGHEWVGDATSEPREDSILTHADPYQSWNGQAPNGHAVRGAANGETNGYQPLPWQSSSYYPENGQATPSASNGHLPSQQPPQPQTDPHHSINGQAPPRPHSRRVAATGAERFYPEDGRKAGRRPVDKNWETGELDTGLYERQMAGINLLLSLATDPAPPQNSPSNSWNGQAAPRATVGRPHSHRVAATGAERFYPEDGRKAGRRPVDKNWETGELDTGLYERQMAGISLLLSLATDVTSAARPGELIASPIQENRRQSRFSVISKLRQDEMTWNSLLLIMSAGLQSAVGFLFWIITAHLFSVSDVGKGSDLISAAGFIGILSLLGLNNGMARYLPEARNRDALISSGLIGVTVVGALGALLYVLLTPLTAPDLSFVEKSPTLTIGFVLITAAAAFNALTDAVFIASRKAIYTFFVDGVIGGFGKIMLVPVLAGAGAYGLFLSSMTGTVLAAAASLVLIAIVMRVRLDAKEPLKSLKPLLRFSGANYVGNVLTVLTTLIVPIILLDRLGATRTGYFFIILQMAQIVYTAALALESTFLAEGSRADADMRALRRRSLRLLVLFFVVTAGLLIGTGRWLLLAFGQQYYHYGYKSLIILVLAAAPISANYWLQTILRLAGKLRAIIVVNVIGMVATCSCVWIGSSHGLTAVAWGWFAGSFVTACVAGVAAREKPARPGWRGGHQVGHGASAEEATSSYMSR